MTIKTPRQHFMTPPTPRPTIGRDLVPLYRQRSMDEAERINWGSLLKETATSFAATFGGLALATGGIWIILKLT